MLLLLEMVPVLVLVLVLVLVHPPLEGTVQYSKHSKVLQVQYFKLHENYYTRLRVGGYVAPGVLCWCRMKGSARVDARAGATL